MRTVIVKAILVYGLLSSFNVRAQDVHKVDSLKQLLSSSQGQNRFDVLFELTIQHAQVYKNKEALDFLEEARRVAVRSGDTLRIVKANRAAGQLMARMGRTKEAISLFRNILPVAERHRLMSDVASIYRGIGGAHTFLGNYAEALRNLFRALEISEQQNDIEYTGFCLQGIGLVYYKLFDDTKALLYYQRSLTLIKQTENPGGVDIIYSNIGLCYSSLSMWKEAQASFDTAYEMCGANCSKSVMMGITYGYGRLAFLRGKFDEAEPHLERSYSLAIELKDLRNQSENLLFLGEIELFKENYSLANKYFKEAESTALIEGYKHILINIYSALSKLNSKQRDFKNAAFYQGRFIIYKDSVVNEKIANSLALTQIEFEQRQNALAITHNKEIIHRQRIQNILITIVAVLLAVLVFALYKMVRSKHILNKKLDDKVRERTHQLKLSHDALYTSRAAENRLFHRAVQDIQAPLASLKGIAHTMRLEFEEAKMRPYASNITVATEKLDQLLHGLAQINGPLLTLLPLCSINKTLTIAMQKVAQTKGTTIIRHHVDGELLAHTNPELLESLIVSLMEPFGSEISVCIVAQINAVVVKIAGRTRDSNDVNIDSDGLVIAAKLAIHIATSRLDKCLWQIALAIPKFADYHNQPMLNLNATR
jgi:tetratricopeptide (TPR) repeat protein